MRSSIPIPTSRHRGFNFIEVLFAVILLGLGFIMIAGVFPVAMQQTTQTANETTAALVARDAFREIQSLGDVTNATANFSSLPSVTQLDVGSIKNDAYYQSDRRYAWVAYYWRQNPTDPFAQVWVIVLQNPNFADPTYPPINGENPPTYNSFQNFPPPIPSAAAGLNNPYLPGGQPAGFAITPGIPPVCNMSGTQGTSSIIAQFAYSPSTGNSYIALNDLAVTTGTNSVPNAVTGAFVLVQSDTNGNAAPAQGYLARPANEMTGRLLRLGTFCGYVGGTNNATISNIPNDVINVLTVPDLAGVTLPWQVFQLQPGMDLKPGGTTISGGIAVDAFGMENTVLASGTLANLPVYIIGAAPEWTGTVTPTTGWYTGPNQDVAAFSTFIRVNTANN
jgi:type II secretory pathway pseudopilin PulG